MVGLSEDEKVAAAAAFISVNSISKV